MKCKACKKSFTPKYKEPCCSTECMKAFFASEEGKKRLFRITSQAKKIVKKQTDQKFKELKEKVTDYDKLLQKEVQKIARFIDYGLPCLARNHHANQIHGGHIFSRGANKNIKFNLHNIHRQGAHSNHYQNDDALLREGLIKEYGQDYFDWLKSTKESPTKKFAQFELKEALTKAREISRTIEKKQRSVEERIELRNFYNLSINLYDHKYLVFNR